jgi:SAM-dependent MidA family methyltransferase
MKWSEFSKELYQNHSFESILDASPPLTDAQKKTLEDFKKIYEESRHRSNVCSLSSSANICSITRAI